MTGDKNPTASALHRYAWFTALVLCGVLTLLVTGCGAKATTGTTTKYRDPRYHYTLKVPSGWTPPTRGKVATSSDGVPAYIVHFIKPLGFRILVRAPLPSYSSIPNGRVLTHDPKAGCPAMCLYLRTVVSGFPALLVHTCTVTSPQTCRDGSNGVLKAEYVDVNSTHIGYELQLADVSGISRTLNKQFGEVLGTFRIAKRG